MTIIFLVFCYLTQCTPAAELFNGSVLGDIYVEMNVLVSFILLLQCKEIFAGALHEDALGPE
jgi:hypothetical protein